MGIRSKSRPESVINAVIELDVIRGPAGDGAADDIIELSQTFCGLTPSLPSRKSRV
jgi:hypothetical protein